MELHTRDVRDERQFRLEIPNKLSATHQHLRDEGTHVRYQNLTLYLDSQLSALAPTFKQFEARPHALS